MSFDIDYVVKNATNVEKWMLLSGSDFWHTAALERFDVPRVRVSDGPNGIRGTRFFGGVSAACIPCGTALGATWDKDLLQKAGKLLGEECISKGAHCWLGPTLNIQRSPMGGRGFESYSEDPHLSGHLAASIIKGCESTGVQATPKHFVCNDQEHERRAVNTIIPDRALREVYLRPFQILARDAQPGGLMTSYNKINGIHVAHDPKILTGIVREEWGWDPIIVSDWHGTYSTTEAVNAGMDLEMPGPPKMRGRLGDFVQSSRLIKQSVLDKRARRVLEFVKRGAKLDIKEGPRDRPEDRKLNREICGKSIVMLKNDDGLLPLPKKAKKVALIGSHMKLPVISGGGSAVLQPYYTVTLAEALSERYVSQGTEITHEVGVPAYKMLPLLSKLIQRPDRSHIGGIMRFFNSPPDTPNRQHVAEEHFQTAYCQLMDYKHPKLNFELFYITAEAIFTPDESGIWDFGLSVYGTANFYLDGELIIDETTEKQKAGGAFFGKGTPEKKGSKELQGGKEYKITLEFGSSATSTSPQIGVTTFGGGGFRLGAARRVDLSVSIENACQLAKEADYAILCTGLTEEWECEGSDRTIWSLPPGVDELVSKVLEAQPKTVLVTQAGTPFGMPWLDKAKSLVHAWYGGNEAGNGIADVLFGDVNPSAKLPLSWPATLKENPAYLNWGSTQGRVMYGEDVFVGYKFYDEMDRPPMFSFGHGLSYTEFSIKPGKASRDAVTVDVENTGDVDGTETLQIYIHAKTSLVRRPKRELHGFAKVSLEPGEAKTVKVEIDKYAASLWDEAEEQWMCEMGEYEVLVGTSSKEQDLISAGSFTVAETSWWLAHVASSTESSYVVEWTFNVLTSLRQSINGKPLLRTLDCDCSCHHGSGIYSELSQVQVCEAPAVSPMAQPTPTEAMYTDVLIVGAGPCGLAVAARLSESTPSALFTDDEHARYWKRFQRIETLQSELNRQRKRSTNSTGSDSGYESDSISSHRIKRPSMVVLDASSNSWLGAWKARFARLNIRHLRSPLFFHPDPRDKDGLLAYAYENGRESELTEIHNVAGKEYSKHARKKQRSRHPKVERHLRVDGRDRIDYFTPSTELFEDYCHSIVDRYELGGLVQQAHVTNITYDDIGCPSQGSLFTVDTNKGICLAKVVIIATGPSATPPLPADHKLEITAASQHAATHVLTSHNLTIPASPSSKSTTAIVIGGGLTSAQVATNLITIHKFAHVHLLLRSAYKLKPFDVSLDWVSKTRNERMAQFWSASTDTDRSHLLIEARNGGSVSPSFDRELQRLVRAGRLTICPHTTISHGAYNEDEGVWEVTTTTTTPALSLPSPTSFSTKVYKPNHIFFATGSAPDFSSIPFLASLQAERPIPTINGLPRLTEDMAYDDDVPLYFTGALAALRLGPGAANLAGARMGAERVAWAVERILGNGGGSEDVSGRGRGGDGKGSAGESTKVSERSEFTGGWANQFEALELLDA